MSQKLEEPPVAAITISYSLLHDFSSLSRLCEGTLANSSLQCCFGLLRLVGIH